MRHRFFNRYQLSAPHRPATLVDVSGLVSRLAYYRLVAAYWKAVYEAMLDEETIEVDWKEEICGN